MTDMPVNLDDMLTSISKRMLIDFNDITSQIEHRGLKGQAREVIVREFLSKYLPKQLGIARGEIISSNGEVSREQDIIIYDKLKCPIYYIKRVA